ncbi:MAG: hypothetical protein ACLUE1_01475 [Adlercreutzia equolifaciens]
MADYDKLAEDAGNLNAQQLAATRFSSPSAVMTQTAGAGKLTTQLEPARGRHPRRERISCRRPCGRAAYAGNFRQAMEEGEISAGSSTHIVSDSRTRGERRQVHRRSRAIGNLKASVVSGLSDTLAQPALLNGRHQAAWCRRGFSLLGQGVSFLVGAMGRHADASTRPSPRSWTRSRSRVRADSGAVALMLALSSLGSAVMALFSAAMPVIATAVSRSAP